MRKTIGGAIARLPLVAVAIWLCSLPLHLDTGSPASLPILTALPCYLVPLGAQLQGRCPEAWSASPDLVKDWHGSEALPIGWTARSLEPGHSGTRPVAENWSFNARLAAPALAERAPPVA